jgi:uncharacterized membrane protein
MKLGESAEVVRSLSAIFSVATIPLIYLLGKNILNRKAGIISASFFTFHSTVLYFAQEARSYSMYTFFVVLSALFFLRYLDIRNMKNLVLYLLFSIVAVYLHTFGVFLIFSQFVYIILFERQKKTIVSFSIAWTLLFVAIIPLFLNESQASGGLLDWIQPVKFSSLLHLFKFLSSQSNVLMGIFGILFTACLAITIYNFTKYHQNKKVFYLYLWFFIPIVVVFIISLVVKPLFIDRYFYYCLVSFLIIVSIPLSIAPVRLWNLLVFATTLLLLFNTQRWYFIDYQKENWKPYVQYVLDNYSSGDALVIYPDRLVKNVEYYYRVDKVPRPELIKYYFPHNPVNKILTSKEIADDLKILDEIMQKHNRVVFMMRISNKDGSGEHDLDLARAIEKKMGKEYVKEIQSEKYGFMSYTRKDKLLSQ